MKNEMGGHAARVGRGEIYTGFWWGDVRKECHLKDPGFTEGGIGGGGQGLD
jgi:hypothetical protein